MEGTSSLGLIVNKHSASLSRALGRGGRQNLPEGAFKEIVCMLLAQGRLTGGGGLYRCPLFCARFSTPPWQHTIAAPIAGCIVLRLCCGKSGGLVCDSHNHKQTKGCAAVCTIGAQALVPWSLSKLHALFVYMHMYRERELILIIFMICSSTTSSNLFLLQCHKS